MRVRQVELVKDGCKGRHVARLFCFASEQLSMQKGPPTCGLPRTRLLAADQCCALEGTNGEPSRGDNGTCFFVVELN